MNSSHLALLFLSLLFSVTAFAQPSDCTPFRLDEPLPESKTYGPMQSVTVKDQGAYGICYAEAASQLIDAYRFGKKHDDRTYLQTAALPAAFEHNTDSEKDPFKGGRVCQVIDHLKREGIRDSYKINRCIYKNETKEKVTALSKIYDSYTNDILLNKVALSLGDSHSSVRFNRYKENRFQQLKNEIIVILKMFDVDAVAVLNENELSLRSLVEFPVLQFIWGIETFACYDNAPPIPIRLPSCISETTYWRSAEDTEAFINYRLKKLKNQPLSINYCSQILNAGRKYEGIVPFKYDCKKSDLADGGPHASLIIGRRWNEKDQKCQYLIRNSWGDSCQSRPMPITLPPELRNDPSLPLSFSKTETPYSIYSKDWECEEGRGTVWVDTDALARSTLSVDYLKRSWFWQLIHWNWNWN